MMSLVAVTTAWSPAFAPASPFQHSLPQGRDVIVNMAAVNVDSTQHASLSKPMARALRKTMQPRVVERSVMTPISLQMRARSPGVQTAEALSPPELDSDHAVLRRCAAGPRFDDWSYDHLGSTHASEFEDYIRAYEPDSFVR